MSAERLFNMINILINKKRVTAVELAEQFDVSVRTVYRDISTLSAAGIPIYTCAGKGGGIEILDSYVLNKSLLSEQEQEQIILALRNFSSISNIQTQVLSDKLSALFKNNNFDWLEVDFSRWGNKKFDNVKFELIKKAILEKRMLTFLYMGSNGELSQRKVKPAKLTYKSKAWYLQAFCTEKKDYRVFKINRINKLQLAEAFTGTLAVPELDESKACLTCQKIKMCFNSSVAFRIFDEFEEDSVEIQANGDYLVTVEMPVDNWLYSYLLSFGAFVEIIEPDFIKKELAKQAEQIFIINSKT